ncbi:SCP2 sterol-binding domain-containing protein [Beduinella massiliensis]|uniref:SCP2 sterol-binding domain-containing protein n=1 Tax=Beduinella massiliensis TaxID=1852363 RepID=UPI000C8434FB
MFRRMTRALKRAVCAVVLFVLRRALDVLGRRDSRVQRELSSLGEGFVLRLSTGEGGPQLCVRLTGGRVRRAGAEESADVTIALKNLDAAFLLLTGTIGVAQAYAQHRFTLRGDITRTMPVVRCVDIAESYLFPWVWAGRILRRRPGKEMTSVGLYLRVFCPFA